MTIQERIQQELIEAMKSRDSLKLDVLRGMKATLKNKEIEKGASLDEPECLHTLFTLVKQRRDSIDQFSKGGRQDLVDREKAELRILEDYLPAPVSEGEILAAIREVISETQAASSKDMGRVMKAVMARFAGKNVEGKFVSDLVRAQLPQ